MKMDVRRGKRRLKSNADDKLLRSGVLFSTVTFVNQGSGCSRHMGNVIAVGGHWIRQSTGRVRRDLHPGLGINPGERPSRRLLQCVMPRRGPHGDEENQSQPYDGHYNYIDDQAALPRLIFPEVEFLSAVVVGSA
ncbi:hypothetical protein MRX96_039498 [Rhipicephalus microplus]